MYERLWKVKALVNGFEVMVMVRAKEEELTGYLDTELPSWTHYSGTTEEEENAARALGMKFYLA